MAYVAAHDFIEAYGLQEFYELLSDEEGLITMQLVSDAVAGTPLDQYSDAQQDAISSALARAQKVFDRASQNIDGKLLARYPLPLPEEAADQVVECCLALSRAGLADDGDNMSKTMKDERAYWRSWLDEVRDGKAHLVGVQPIATGGNVNQRLTAKAPSNIDWQQY